MLAGTERQQQTTLRPNQPIRPPTHNGTTTNLQLPVLAAATAYEYNRRLPQTSFSTNQPTNQPTPVRPVRSVQQGGTEPGQDKQSSSSWHVRC